MGIHKVQSAALNAIAQKRRLKRHIKKKPCFDILIRKPYPRSVLQKITIKNLIDFYNFVRLKTVE